MECKRNNEQEASWLMNSNNFEVNEAHCSYTIYYPNMIKKKLVSESEIVGSSKEEKEKEGEVGKENEKSHGSSSGVEYMECSVGTGYGMAEFGYSNRYPRKRLRSSGHVPVRERK